MPQSHSWPLELERQPFKGISSGPRRTAHRGWGPGQCHQRLRKSGKATCFLRRKENYGGSLACLREGEDALAETAHAHTTHQDHYALLCGSPGSLDHGNEFTVHIPDHLSLLLVIPENSLSFHKSIVVISSLRIKHFFLHLTPPTSKLCTSIIFPTYSDLGSPFSLNNGTSFMPYASWALGLVSFVSIFILPIIVLGTEAKHLHSRDLELN